MLITRLLLILEVYSTKPTHTKSWARNFLMLDLTFGLSFKVKQWFTGFGELSFRWIQICIGLRCIGLVNFGVWLITDSVPMTGLCNRDSGWHFQNIHFIALIHPIQWTIANPVGADRPDKRQKKTSCVSTSWPVPVLCIHQVAHGIYFLSRQHDIISSFSFGACTVQTCFQHLQSF